MARAAQREPERLSTPGGSRRSIMPRVRFSHDTFGDFAEAFARFMGTARFILYMTLFVIVWVALNLIGLYGFRWDPYPFILLNLFFSTQASYAAPLILLAQNRQEARDRVALNQDRQQAAQSRADMDFLAREIASLRMSVGDLATRDYLRTELRNELRSILSELDEPATERHDRAHERSVDKGAERSADRAAERSVDKPMEKSHTRAGDRRAR